MTQIRIPIFIATALCVLSLIPTVAAHGSSASSSIPGWILLLGSVLGLWTVIGSSVLLFDRLLRDVFGIQ